jgi:hypothetical protein
VGGAPAIEGQRSAVMAQKFGVQCLQKSECLQARGGALLPRRRAATLGTRSARNEHEGERHERFAGGNVHLLRLSAGQRLNAGSPARSRWAAPTGVPPSTLSAMFRCREREGRALRHDFSTGERCYGCSGRRPCNPAGYTSFGPSVSRQRMPRLSSLHDGRCGVCSMCRSKAQSGT